MKDYEVHLVDKSGNSLKRIHIKSKSAESAYQAFVESNKPIPSEAVRINVYWGFLQLQSQDFALTSQDLDSEGHVEKSSNSQKLEQESSKTNKIDERVVKLLEAQNEKLYEVTTLLKGIRLGIFIIFLLAFGIPWIISTLS